MSALSRSTTTGGESEPAWPAFAWPVIAVAVAALVLVTLRTLLFGRVAQLPGTDSSIYYAWEVYTRAALAAGRLPHWNPFSYAGSPHLADTETTVLYPLAMALRWIPAVRYMSWMPALHMWIGGMGSAYLARQLGLRWEAAAAAAVAGALGGSMPAWLYNGHVPLLYVASWLPWVLALMILSARRPTVWPHWALVCVLVLQFLAGYLQGNIYIAGAAVLYALWFLAWPPPGISGWARTRLLGQLSIAGVLAAGLAAFQLWPTLLAVAEAGRTQGLPAEAAMRYSWSFADLVRFFRPFAGLDSPTPFRYLGDHTVYVGWVLTILAPIALVDRRHRRVAAFFAVLGLLALGFAVGDALPLYRLHYWLFPGLRIPGRLLFLVTLSTAMLGAIGLDRLASWVCAPRWRRLQMIVVFVLVGVVTADITLYARGAVYALSPGLPPVVHQLPAVPGRTLSVCDSALNPIDLTRVNRAAFDGKGSLFLRVYEAFELAAVEDGPVRMRRDLIDQANVTAVVTCAPFDSPGLQLINERGDVRIYRNDTAWPRAVWGCGGESMTAKEVADLLHYVGYRPDRQIDPRPIVNIRWATSVDEASRQQLEAHYHLSGATFREGTTWRYALDDRSGPNVRALLSDRAIEDTHGIDRFAGTVAALPSPRERQLLFASVPCKYQGTVSDIRADQIGGDVSADVDAPIEGLLFLSEPYFPERIPYVDGREVTAVKANLMFTAVPLPAGRHHVELRYEARRFHKGLIVSVLTLVAWFAATRMWRAGTTATTEVSAA
ncbi:MAG TPA: hypothetical protein VL173_08370 [Vicinamibacterales bacterium]|nr:hypothetical protein [Vicinamibacterales bacterium]